MATSIIHDLYSKNTLHIIAGSNEFFFFDLYHTNSTGMNKLKEPINLSTVQEIEWLFAPYSVLQEKKVAKIKKSLSNGDIYILKNSEGKLTNRIQLTIKSIDTENLQGAFLHQIVIIDGAGSAFIPFEGIININKKIIKW